MPVAAGSVRTRPVWQTWHPDSDATSRRSYLHTHDRRRRCGREIGAIQSEGGFTQHTSGTGQACHRFFFRNFMLELIWIENASEARSEQTRRTSFGGAAPGLGAAPHHSASFSGRIPDRRQPLEHPAGLGVLTRVRLVCPALAEHSVTRAMADQNTGSNFSSMTDMSPRISAWIYRWSCATRRERTRPPDIECSGGFLTHSIDFLIRLVRTFPACPIRPGGCRKESRQGRVLHPRRPADRRSKSRRVPT